MAFYRYNKIINLWRLIMTTALESEPEDFQNLLVSAILKGISVEDIRLGTRYPTYAIREWIAGKSRPRKEVEETVTNWLGQRPS